MITFREYKQILASLTNRGIRSVSVSKLVGLDDFKGVLSIKHDVESKVHLAMQTAEIEHQLGHATTYYFQGSLLFESEASDIVMRIAKLGHEVTYHYDVLDACEGDFSVAVKEFDRYKMILEGLSGEILKTVCPHGNPIKIRNGWKSNKDFFRSEFVRQLYPDIVDVVVDFGRLLPQGLYISDAGFQLRKIGNISGNDASHISAISDGIPIAWESMVGVVSESQGVVLSIHTHRMRDSQLALFILRARIRLFRSLYLFIAKVPFIRAFIGKFYGLTRHL